MAETTVRREVQPEHRALTKTLVKVRMLMDRGDLSDAIALLEKFYEFASELEWSNGRGLEKILAEGRALAGELRGRMSEVALNGSPSLGARALPPVAKIESAIEVVRDYTKRGYYASALELLETVHQSLWYWEDTKDPDVQRLLDEVRRLAGEIRGKSAGGMSGRMGEVTPEIEKYYTSEACPYLAIALHERTGWPLAMLWDAGEEPQSYGGRKTYPTIAHVFVLTPEGSALDIRGERPIERLKEEWYDLVEPRIEEITLSDLKGLMGDNRPLFACSRQEMTEARKVVDELL